MIKISALKTKIKEILRKDFPKLDLSTHGDLKDYYHLTFSLTCGILITICLFVASLKIESERYRSDFSVISETLGSNLDLLISNQIMRIQNFDSELKGALKNIDEHRVLIDAILRGSSFTTLIDLRTAKAPILEPTINVLKQIDVEGQHVDATNIVREARFQEEVQNLIESRSKSIPLILQLNGKPLFILLWRAGERSGHIFAFVGPAGQLVPADNFVKKEIFVLLRQGLDNTWLISKNDDEAVVMKPISNEEIQSLNVRSTNSRTYTPKFSSGEFSYEILSIGSVELRYFWPLMVLFLGLIITSLFAFLLFSLINRNIEINQVVIEKTKHLAIESQKAIDAAYSKTRFLANVSHEVRTPLNMIMGMAELLKETKLSDKQSEYVDNFKNASAHLLSLIDDILDMARIDSNEVKFSGETFNLLYFFEEVCQLIAPACRLKKIDFYCEIDPDLPQFINTDPRRLRQILINLLNNALKFTEKGYLELSMHLLKEENSSHQFMEITVKDTGIGIPQAKREEIFRAFYQVNPSVTRTKGGVGLGLSIVQAIVSRFKGNINVTSQERQGSTFTVKLPLSRPDNHTLISNFRWRSSPIKKILIACKDQKLSQILLQYASSLKIQADLFVVNGDISLLKVWVKNYDVVFADASDAINKNSLEDLAASLRSNAKIVYFDKMGEPLSEEMKKKFGGRVVVTHPPALLSVFFEYLGMHDPSLISEQVREAAVRNAPALNLSKEASLLIVDDDFGNRTLMKAYLEGSRLKARFAANGQEALEMYREEAPDILVADLQMPIMDGFTLVSKIRELEDSTPQTLDTKIMILTADALDETAEQARQMNVDAYLTKPIRKGQFLGTISELLN